MPVSCTGFPSSLVLNTLPQLRFKPATRLENACATGSAAIHSGLQAIKAGESKHVLVIGFEKMTELATAQVGEVLLKACYAKEEAGIPGGLPGSSARSRRATSIASATSPMRWR
jgi:acetyl-CoA C-acetyltransferase